MEYIILATTITLALLIFLRLLKKKRLVKKIDKIRSAWGRQKNENFEFNKIKDYADKIKEEEYHRLTDQTLEDIDFYGVFEFIDRTISKIGQQFLFRKLITPTDKVDNYQEELIELFSTNVKLREEVQLDLLKLSKDDAYYVSSLLSGKLLQKPKWFKLLSIYITAIILLVALSVKFPVILIFLIVPLLFNMFLHYSNKNNSLQFIQSFTQLSLVINISNSLSKKDALLDDPLLAKNSSYFKVFQLKSILLNIDYSGKANDDLSQLASYCFELIKAFFLIEYYTLYKLIEEIENKQSSILFLFNYIGKIDAALSIASLRADSYNTCRPVISGTGKQLKVKNIYHPLIECCVENDLSISGKGILITGSNMSGKTTFLRTLALNSILAQTINTCFAEEFSSPVLKQFSSIRIDDNLFEGKSYYFQEVSVMASLIKEVESNFQNLFVLDEVFKGTNTVERIAAAKAILSYLNRNNNLVIVSTHDVELSEMLADQYDLYHFTELVDNKQIHFDHKIKAGPLRTRNAIKLLELYNYPAEIISEARKISRGSIEEVI